jgi:large subunit ribosomal protein L23
MRTILRMPVVTEKAASMIADNKYTFIVDPNTNKIEVRQFIEKTYGVEVVNVNMLKKPSKKRRRGKIVGETTTRKKVIVTIKEGQSIEPIKGMF